ncbi:MAG: SsrA-binding protein SmpB [Dehalococcoidia bacterium]
MNKKDTSLATNRKARYDYSISETFEAGLVLLGTEIKSIRQGKISISEGYIYIKNNEAWLENTNIPIYEPAGEINQHDPYRSKKLLLTKKQINYIKTEIEKSGFTAIPLKVYIKHRVAKLLFGLGLGKKQYDKREVIKKRDSDRTIERAMKKRISDFQK